VASTRTFGGNGTPVDEQSLGELVATATRDMSLLVRQEIELAKTELTEQATRLGVGAGLLSGAGLLGVLAVILASFAGAFGFADGLNIPVWAGFLCMTGVYVVIAAVLAFLGVGRVKSVTGPQRTQLSVQESLDWVKHPARHPPTAAVAAMASTAASTAAPDGRSADQTT